MSIYKLAYISRKVHLSVHEAVFPCSLSSQMSLADQCQLPLSVEDSVAEGADEGVVVLVLQHA